MCDSGPIGIEHLPSELTAHRLAGGASRHGQNAHDQLDAHAIRVALERNRFSRTAAAKELGIHKTTLFRRMKRLGIALPETDGRSRRTPAQ